MITTRKTYKNLPMLNLAAHLSSLKTRNGLKIFKVCKNNVGSYNFPHLDGTLLAILDDSFCPI